MIVARDAPRPGDQLVNREQWHPEQLRQAVAAVAHHVVMVDSEDRAADRREQVHPGPGRVHVPLIEDGGHAALLEEPPAADARELARGVALQEMRALDLGGPHEELEPVWQLRLPHIPPELPDAVLIPLLELVGL